MPVSCCECKVKAWVITNWILTDCCVRPVANNFRNCNRIDVRVISWNQLPVRSEYLQAHISFLSQPALYCLSLAADRVRNALCTVHSPRCSHMPHPETIRSAHGRDHFRLVDRQDRSRYQNLSKQGGYSTGRERASRSNRVPESAQRREAWI